MQFPFTLCIWSIVLATSYAQTTLTGNLAPGSTGGVQATLGANSNLINNSRGQTLDVHGQVSKQFHPGGPTQYGVGADWHSPKNSASIDVLRQGGATGIQATGSGNFFTSRDKRTTLDGNVNVSKQFGGGGPNQKPNIGGGINFVHRFK